MTNHKCCTNSQKPDYLLWASLGVILLSFVWANVATGETLLMVLAKENINLLFSMWDGIVIGIVAVGILNGIPKGLVMSIIGRGGSLNGILRATAGGVLLDLCSHGILLVGMQLYKRGASLGQVAAFLIASPWNSLSLTFIMLTLVGWQWTALILVLSMLMAIISGLLFDAFERRGILPQNPYTVEGENHNGLHRELQDYLKNIHWRPRTLLRVLKVGIIESRMILRWILFGIVLAAVIRTFVPTDLFVAVFGPTIAGLGATLLFATILEVCSEGSMPVAADFLLRAKAPGNMFTFLMTGVSTDYTEILSLKETTKSWKIAFFLPLVTLPQVVIFALLLNNGM